MTKRLVTIFGLLALILTGGNAFAQEPTPYSTPDEDRLFTLSPDGSMVASTSTGGRDLCIYTVPEAELVNCVDLEPYQVRIDPVSIRWSPANDALVFSEPSALLFIDSDIMHFDIASGELTYLTDDGIAARIPISNDEPFDPIPIDIMPAWSPDGSTIAFSRTMWQQDADVTSSMMMLDVATNEVTELALFTSAGVLALPYPMVWSPDGATVYGTAWFQESERDKQGVWAFDVATGAFEQLAGLNPDYRHAAPMVTAISPDGGQLVVSYPDFIRSTFSTEIRSGYALLDVADGTITNLEPSAEFGGEQAVVVAPAFSPNGRALIFGVQPIDRDPAYVIARDLDTGAETVLAEFDDGSFPITYDLSAPTQIGGNTLFVLTAPNMAWVIDLPKELTETPGQSATPEAATPEPAAATARTGDDAATLREAPDSAAGIIAILPPDSELAPLGDPIEAGGYTWIEVLVIDTGETGFVRTDFLAPVG